MKALSISCWVAVLGFFCSIAAAQPTVPQGQERGAFRLNLGYQGSYNRTELAYETPTLWQGSLLNRPIDLKLEAGLAYWHTNDSHVRYGSRTSIWQVSLTPMLRWWIGQQWYIEGGIGATAMSHTRFANREISTAFQFGDHIGIVRTFGDDWRVGLRLSHFSNTSIKRPNPGLNVIQLTLSRSF
jgi:lipid A 3-O-deacylase